MKWWLVIMMLLVVGAIGARIKRQDDESDEDEDDADMWTSDEEYDDDEEYEDMPLEPCSHDSSFNEILGTQPHNPALALPVGSLTKFPEDVGSDAEDARIDKEGWLAAVTDEGPDPYIQIDFLEEGRGVPLISQLITKANAYVKLEYKPPGGSEFVSLNGQRFEHYFTFQPRVKAEQIRVILQEPFVPSTTEYRLQVGAYACFPEDPHKGVSEEDDEDK